MDNGKDVWLVQMLLSNLPYQKEGILDRYIWRFSLFTFVWVIYMSVYRICLNHRVSNASQCVVHITMCQMLCSGPYSWQCVSYIGRSVSYILLGIMYMVMCVTLFGIMYMVMCAIYIAACHMHCSAIYIHGSLWHTWQCVIHMLVYCRHGSVS